jgi:hypothetical protein
LFRDCGGNAFRPANFDVDLVRPNQGLTVVSLASLVALVGGHTDITAGTATDAKQRGDCAGTAGEQKGGGEHIDETPGELKGEEGNGECRWDCKVGRWGEFRGEGQKGWEGQ